MTDVVTVSKKWNSPIISHSIVPEGLSITMSLEDFITALHAELGHPVWIQSTAALDVKLRQAAAKVIQHMKDETVKVL